MEIIKKPRNSSKTRFTATHRKARYIGDTPSISGTSGLYYYSRQQQSYIYRPDGDEKADWYRVLKHNIQDIEHELL